MSNDQNNEMQPDDPKDFRILYGRHASWVVHNQLKDNRGLINKALTAFLRSMFGKERPKGYKPSELVYYASPSSYVNSQGQHVGGVLGLLLAVDDSVEKSTRVLVLSTQVPIAPETAHPPRHSGLHSTTEVFPLEDYLLIPISMEFARRIASGKRSNYAVYPDGEIVTVPQSAALVTGFKHFISGSYSRYGLHHLELLISIRRWTSLKGGVTAHDNFNNGESLRSELRREISSPLQMIEEEIYSEQGRFAVSNTRDLASFFNETVAWAAEVAYRNAVAFSEEAAHSMFTRSPSEDTIEDDQAVVEDDAATIDYPGIARALVLYEGALEAILMLADIGPLPMRRLIDIFPEENSVEALAELRRTGLISKSKTKLWLTELGDMVVTKLRSKL